MKYEFKCMKCGDYLVKGMTIAEMERTILKCKCGGIYKKLYSATPIVVKGRGTYTVSYPKKDK